MWSLNILRFKEDQYLNFIDPMWNHLCMTYKVDRQIIIGKDYNNIAEAQKELKGPFVYLTPRAPADSLVLYKHPEEATYCIGHTGQGFNNQILNDGDRVFIESPGNLEFWPIQAATIALYDRYVKGN